MRKAHKAILLAITVLMASALAAPAASANPDLPAGNWRGVHALDTDLGGAPCGPWGYGCAFESDAQDTWDWEVRTSPTTVYDYCQQARFGGRIRTDGYVDATSGWPDYNYTSGFCWWTTMGLKLQMGKICQHIPTGDMWIRMQFRFVWKHNGQQIWATTYGKLIRDQYGNVTDIRFGDESGNYASMNTSSSAPGHTYKHKVLFELQDDNIQLVENLEAPCSWSPTY